MTPKTGRIKSPCFFSEVSLKAVASVKTVFCLCEEGGAGIYIYIYILYIYIYIYKKRKTKTMKHKQKKRRKQVNPPLHGEDTPDAYLSPSLSRRGALFLFWAGPKRSRTARSSGGKGASMESSCSFQSSNLHQDADGQNPFRTTLNPWETIACWFLQGSHHSTASSMMQDFVHPQ